MERSDCDKTVLGTKTDIFALNPYDKKLFRSNSCTIHKTEKQKNGLIAGEKNLWKLLNQMFEGATKQPIPGLGPKNV